MQQGAGPGGASFSGVDGASSVKTSTRSVDERLRASRVPYADLLERALFEHLSRQRPLPRLWPFPGTHAGALLIGHPAPRDTRAAIGYAEWSRRQQGTSTVFLAGDRANPSQLALLKEADAALGLSWVRGAAREPMVTAVGVGGLKPFKQELSLAEQVKRFEELSGERVVIAHVEEERFAPDWSTTFAELRRGPRAP